MKIGIITTYPEKGSKNIGDYLITNSTELAIQALVGCCQFERFFRADTWDRVDQGLSAVDHIVIACMAIREQGMFTRIYPYAEQLIGLSIPYSVLSAGTELAQVGRDCYAWRGSIQERRLLEKFLEGASGVSSRGLLTHRFLALLGIDSPFLGDIAFYDPRYLERKFTAVRSIRKIAISDPHYWLRYYRPMMGLMAGLQTMFPEAKIEFLLHGKSGIRRQLDRTGIAYRPIYEQPSDGLDVYDEFDLHVGFRVHGHVSALKRCKPSYLLEQDGRGADYGSSIPVNCSVPFFQSAAPWRQRMIKTVEYLRLQRSLSHNASLPGSIFRVLAMIDEHRKDGFQNFLGLERKIQEMNRSNLEFLQLCLGDLKSGREKRAA